MSEGPMRLWATNGQGRRAGGLLIALLAVVGGPLVAPSAAGALQPVPGEATVDGSAAEWTPADDVAALVGNDAPHLERGRLSLRYDCGEQVLFALLLAGPGLHLEATDADEAYLRLGSEAKLVKGTDEVDGDAPDAAWVDRSGGTARGIELSAPLAPGSHGDLRVHAKLADDSEDGYETLDLSARYEPLATTCAEPTGAESTATETPTAPPGPVDLARTGAPLLPLLAAVGAFLVAAGAALRSRRWDRPAAR